MHADSARTRRLVFIPMLVALAATVLPGWLICAQAEEAPSARWEAAITKFEQSDRTQPPPESPLLFTGSSSVVHWRSLAEDFTFAPVINRGFGGSQVSDLIAYVDRVIVAYEPRVVVVYSGDNDVAAGKSSEQIVADFATLYARIHEALPQTRLVIIGPKLSPRRWHLTDGYRAVNAGLKRWAAEIEGVDVFDINDLMLAEDGLPREELYSDGLHLTPEGYARWTELLRPQLREIWSQACEMDAPN